MIWKLNIILLCFSQDQEKCAFSFSFAIQQFTQIYVSKIRS